MKMTSLFKAQQEEYFNNLCQMVTNMLELPEGSLASKSRKKLGWVPEITFNELVEKMIDGDLDEELLGPYLQTVQD